MIIRAWRRLKAAWMLRRLKGARREAVEYQLRSIEMLTLLDADRDRLAYLQRLVAEAADAAEQHATDALELHKQHADVVAGLQSTVKILEDVQLPLLTAITERDRQRYREEVQIQSMRLAAAGGRSPPEEM